MTWWCCTQCPCRVALGAEDWKALHERNPVVHVGPVIWTLVQTPERSVAEEIRRALGEIP